jgi:two-component system, OmpR family, response regulator
MNRESRQTILLVDDNPQIRSFIQPALEDSGFLCIEAANGEEAVYEAEASRPDLIVLDIELGDPTMDGLDTCKQIRSLGLTMPVIFLTVRATAEDLESGLRVAGPGSDYVRKLQELRRMQVEGVGISDLQVAHKASDTRELIARIRARLPVDLQRLGPDLRLNRKARGVETRTNGSWQVVPLQPLEYAVLETLVDANGAVVGTWDLFERVFEDRNEGAPDPDALHAENYKNRVWVCIANLRRKIRSDEDHEYIATVHGIGYRFEEKRE